VGHLPSSDAPSVHSIKSDLSLPPTAASHHTIFNPKSLLKQKEAERLHAAEEERKKHEEGHYVAGTTRAAIKAQTSRLVGGALKPFKGLSNGLSPIQGSRGLQDGDKERSTGAKPTSTSPGGAQGTAVGTKPSRTMLVASEEAVNTEKHREMIAHFKLRALSVNQAVDVSSQDHANLINADELRSSRLIKRNSAFVKWWELMTMLLIVFQALYLPYVIGFDPAKDSVMDGIQFFTDVVFMMDVVLQFNITFKDGEGMWLTSRRDVAWYYVTHGFIVDVVAAIPFERLSGSGNAQSTGLLKILRLPRLMRIVKIFRVMKALKVDIEMQRWILYSRHAHIMRFMWNILLIVIVSHFVSCMWYAIARDEWWEKELFFELSSTGFDGELCCCNKPQVSDEEKLGFVPNPSEFLEYVPATDAWADDTNTTTSACYEFGGMGHFKDEFHNECVCKSQAEKYITVFYSVTEMLIGQEHMQPISSDEKVFCACFTIIGALIMAFTFGNVAVNINNFYAASSNYKRKMEFLFESMKNMNLPRSIQRRVYKYYEYVHATHGSLDGKITSFVPELSEKLQAEILLYLRIEMIASVPFFAACSPSVVYNLVMELRLQVFLPKDYVVVKGELGNEMYFIQEGSCEVTIATVNMPTAVPAQVQQAERRRREEEQNKNDSGKNARARRQSAGMQATSLSASIIGEFHRVKASMVESAEVEMPEHATKRKSVSGITLAHQEDAETVEDEWFDEHEKILKKLPKGSFFGEVALLLSVKRTANVRSVSFSELCILDREVFAKILGNYKEDQAIMEEIILSKYESHSNVMAEINAGKMQKKEENDSDLMKIAEISAAAEREVKSSFEFAQKLEKKLSHLESILERTNASITYMNSTYSAASDTASLRKSVGDPARKVGTPAGQDLAMRNMIEAMIEKMDNGFRNVFEVIGSSNRELRNEMNDDRRETERHRRTTERALTTLKRQVPLENESETRELPGEVNEDGDDDGFL
jgi:CRP-like cAMP-binding protein